MPAVETHQCAACTTTHFPTCGRRFEAAPMELIEIPGRDIYKDFAPTEPWPELGSKALA
jgi:hypothetical protein